MKNDPAFRPNPPAAPTGGPADDKPKLTIEEATVAAGMGVKPDDYLKWKDQYTDNKIPEEWLGVDPEE